MNIIEQVKSQIHLLRKLSDVYNAEWKEEAAFTFAEAADTIESLYTKLQATNMEHINPNEILKEIREKAQELSNQHWGDDERHLVGKGIECMCVQAENIISKHMERSADCSGWIPCSERLPEEKGWYLVYAKNQRPFVSYFKGKTFPLNNHYHEIIAWQPLPEPYREP